MQSINKVNKYQLWVPHITLKHIQNLALYLFFFFVNFQELKLFGVGFFSIPKLTGLLYVFTILPDLGKFIVTNNIRKFLIPIWSFFGFLTFISLINISFDSFYFFDFGIFQNIILFWFLINHGRRHDMILEKGLISLALGSVALSLLFSANIGVSLDETGRVSLFGDNPNIIALRMCISIMILLSVVIQNNLKIGLIRYLLLTPIPLMLKLLAETGSRVGIIAFVLCFLTGVILLKTKRTWIKAIIFALAIIAGIAIWQFLMQYDALITRLMQSYEKGDLSGREEIYSQVIPVILHNPIWGIGETRYTAIFGEMSPHNVFLEILAYTGIIGLLLYLTFFFQVVKSALIVRKVQMNILPILLLIPVLGFLSSAQILTQKLGWIIYAYIIVCFVCVKRKKESETLQHE